MAKKRNKSTRKTKKKAAVKHGATAKKDTVTVETGVSDRVVSSTDASNSDLDLEFEAQDPEILTDASEDQGSGISAEEKTTDAEPETEVTPTTQTPEQADEQLKGIRRLVAKIHGGLARLLSSATDGEVQADPEDLSDLDEAGAHLAKKYDTKGWIQKHWPELLYVLALLSAGLKIGWQYVQWRKKADAETPKDPDVPVIDLPDARSG